MSDTMKSPVHRVTEINPFESITETFFHKRTSEFNKIGLTDYSNELIFIPRYFNRAIDETANLLRNLPLIKHLIGPPFEHQEQLNKLLAQQKLATSYQEWFEISVKLDKFLQNDQWKLQDESTLYDYKLIKENLETLHEARLNKDYPKLLYLVRTTWTRNLGNIGNVNLYRHSHVGTKKLIEDYIEECELILQELTSPECPLDDRYVLSMLLQTRKLIGRTGLVLSGGGCFGLFHIGVLSNLLELNLLPRIISGSSAGAIIASILCVQSQEETLNLISTIETKNFDIFEETANKEHFLVNLARFLKYGTWFDNKYLQKTMMEFLGDLTFRESYNRTGRILNITVSPASIHEQPTLLNYLTAPNVLIWSAVCASCSLPGVFPSSTIYEKHNGRRQEWNHTSVKFVDGSVDNDMPITRLSEMFNVDHIIACQCNPHVVPFLKMSIACVGGEIENEYSAKLKKFLNRCYDLWSSEVMHYLEVLSELGIFKNISTKLRSVLAQQYSGDITIIPDLRLTEMGKLLANPTPKFLLDATVRGARATWPKLTLIKNHCSIEFALDKSISTIRSRLINTRIGLSLPLISSPRLQDDPTFNNIEDDDDDLSDNFKVTSELQSSSSSSSMRHHRHRSETLSVASLHSASQLHKSHQQQQQPQLHHQNSAQTIRSKNSMPLMYGVTSKIEKLKQGKRRRRTLSITSSSTSGHNNKPNMKIESKYMNYSLPGSTSTTQPPSPFQMKTKEFFSYNRIHSSNSINTAYKPAVSPKTKIKSRSQSIAKINSTFFKNDPKVMQRQSAPPKNLDPGDDDVIIRKITANPNHAVKDREDDDDVEDDGDETEHDDNDDLADGYEDDTTAYTISGLSTPMR